MSDQSIAARVDAALELDDDPMRAGPELLPSRLARAASAVLQVDGTSLSMMSADLRIPLGASDPAATRAERLQITLDQGPCLDVFHDRTARRSGPADMERSWPLFHHELRVQTPFRSVVAVPLQFTPHGDGGALDLYLIDPDGFVDVDMTACTQAAEHVVKMLLQAITPGVLDGWDDASSVPWLQAADARARMDVWVAIGILIARHGLESDEGLALMRAWARSHETDLDRVAAQLVGGALDPDLLGT